jgi:hypothetical protein
MNLWGIDIKVLSVALVIHEKLGFFEIGKVKFIDIISVHSPQ